MTNLIDKQEEMPVARVQMRFDTQGANLVKMVAVQVCVYSEKAADDRAYSLAEIARERDTDLIREDGLIVE